MRRYFTIQMNRLCTFQNSYSFFLFLFNFCWVLTIWCVCWVWIVRWKSFSHLDYKQRQKQTFCSANIAAAESNRHLCNWKSEEFICYNICLRIPIILVNEEFLYYIFLNHHQTIFFALDSWIHCKFWDEHIFRIGKQIENPFVLCVKLKI